MMKFTRGETFTTILLAASGEVTGAEVVTASLKKARNGAVPGPTAPVMASFEVTFVAEILPSKKPGWHLTIPAAVSDTLTPGDYVSDARVVMANGVIEYSPPNFITVEQRVT